MAEAFHRQSPVHGGPLVRVDGRYEEEQLSFALLGWIGSNGVDLGAHTLRAQNYLRAALERAREEQL